MDERTEPNLEQLADVEAPDAVSRALRRFRWRAFLYISLPIVTAVAVIGAFLFVTIRPNLDTIARIERASGHPSTSVYETGQHELDGGVQLLVLNAVELEQGLGERLLNRIFQSDVADRGTPVGVELVLIAPDADDDTGFDVRPKDPLLLENNVFAGSAQVGRPGPDRTIWRRWFVLQPEGREQITFVVDSYDRRTGDYRNRPVGEVSISAI